MADAIPHSMSMLTMYKLSRLAEQRADYFLELQTSGRWKHYYGSQEALDVQLRETANLAAYWQRAIEIARAANTAPPEPLPAYQPPNVVPLFAKAS
jgi:hypothetical protein